MSGVLFFRDQVRRMSFDIAPDKVHVVFEKAPMVLWLKPGALELLDRLADAAEEKAEVSVAWDPETQEIVSVVVG